LAPTGREAVALQARLLPGSSSMPAVCKFPPLVPPLAGESIQSPVFFRSPNVEKRIALLPSAYRNLECTARRFGHVRQPTYVTHDCYKNAVEDLTAIMQNLLTRAAPLPWGGTHEAAPACPYTSTAVQANSYRCLKHSPASVGQKFCICTNSGKQHLHRYVYGAY